MLYIEQSLGGDHWSQFNRTSVSQPRSDFDHLVGYIYNLHICMDVYRVSSYKIIRQN